MAIVAQVIDGKVVANYTDGKANKDRLGFT